MFLNATAHELTGEQILQATIYSRNIVNLKEDNPGLYEELVNCPDERDDLEKLSEVFLDYLRMQYIQSERNLTVHFPIGSPVFNALFFRKLEKENLPIRTLFSHSERRSIDKKQADGSVIKKAIFQFVKFIEI
jgi:hypothetical protein